MKGSWQPVPGRVVSDEIVAARAGWSRKVARGEVLRIIDLDVLCSANCSAMFTVVEDTCGFRDTIGGGCSSAFNCKRYGKPGDPSCRDNFLRELARHGMWPLRWR